MELYSCNHYLTIPCWLYTNSSNKFVVNLTPFTRYRIRMPDGFLLNLSLFQKKSVGHNTNIRVNTPPPPIIAPVTSLTPVGEREREGGRIIKGRRWTKSERGRSGMPESFEGGRREKNEERLVF